MNTEPWNKWKKAWILLLQIFHDKLYISFKLSEHHLSHPHFSSFQLAFFIWAFPFYQ